MKKTRQLKKISMSDVLLNYQSHSNDTFNRPIVIKHPPAGNQEKVTLYTDGSCHNAKGTYDGKAFAGSAWIAEIETGERLFNCKPLYNANSIEAELTAILCAIKAIKRPSNVIIVSDSLDSIQVIQNLDAEIKMSEESNNYSENQYEKLHASTKSVSGLSHLLKEIKSEIDNNECLVGIKMQWVRSHTLDNYKNNDIITENLSKKEKVFASRLIGNAYADQYANRAVDTAIKNCVNKFMRSTPPEYLVNDDRINAIAFKKNLACSDYATAKCIETIAKIGIREFDKSSIVRFLGKDAYAKAIEASFEYEQLDFLKRTGKEYSMDDFQRKVGVVERQQFFVNGSPKTHFNKHILDPGYNTNQKTEDYVLNSAEKTSMAAERADKFSKRFGGFMTAKSSKSEDIIKSLVSKSNNIGMER